MNNQAMNKIVTCKYLNSNWYCVGERNYHVHCTYYSKITQNVEINITSSMARLVVWLLNWCVFCKSGAIT